MTTLTIEIRDAANQLLAMNTDSDQVHLVYNRPYQPGDSVIVKSLDAGQYLLMQLDDAMNEAFVFLAGHEYQFIIPFAEKKTSYSPKAFSGDLHVMTAQLASPEDISAYKNLAENVYDHHDNTSLFPHASANVETRGEAVFAARNAINGNTVSFSHGEWPFESWGINMQDDAEFKVSFGRMVRIDKIRLVLRADFPHDNYWTQVTLSFSDGSSEVARLVKSGKAQTISLIPKNVEWVKLSELIKSDEPALFPALTQFEAYGHEINERGE
ncbi:carbohydrate-binding protein [Paenibacillus sp. FSL R5-0517]|uniref:carbohydrate-binding protein n=1 Tax=Paenibacillus sp. FSL R5-0517 TaxID=2921647 RepID=UPI0030DCAED3